jgi:hypothetical protein
MDEREKVKELRKAFVAGCMVGCDFAGGLDSTEIVDEARRRYPMPKKVVPRKVPWPESNGEIYLDSLGRIKHTGNNIVWYTEAETAALRDLLTGPETIEVEDNS